MRVGQAFLCGVEKGVCCTCSPMVSVCNFSTNVSSEKGPSRGIPFVDKNDGTWMANRASFCLLPTSLARRSQKSSSPISTILLHTLMLLATPPPKKTQNPWLYIWAAFQDPRGASILWVKTQKILGGLNQLISWLLTEIKFQFSQQIFFSSPPNIPQNDTILADILPAQFFCAFALNGDL